MQLKTLRLKKSQSTLPVEILFEDFTHLEIFGGNLTEIPAKLFEKKGLINLRVKNSGLAALPLEVANPSPTLEVLALAQNNLTQIPNWVGKFRALKNLDLGKNQITELTAIFPSGLERLNLESNALQSLPDSLYALKKLNHLSVDHNPLSAETVERIYESFGIWLED